MLKGSSQDKLYSKCIAHLQRSHAFSVRIHISRAVKRWLSSETMVFANKSVFRIARERTQWSRSSEYSILAMVFIPERRFSAMTNYLKLWRTPAPFTSRLS
jgi:hypothetical protein